MLQAPDAAAHVPMPRKSTEVEECIPMKIILLCADATCIDEMMLHQTVYSVIVRGIIACTGLP